MSVILYCSSATTEKESVVTTEHTEMDNEDFITDSQLCSLDEKDFQQPQLVSICIYFIIVFTVSISYFQKKKIIFIQHLISHTTIFTDPPVQEG